MDTKEIAQFFFMVTTVGSGPAHQGLLAMSRAGFLQDLPNQGIVIRAAHVARIIQALSGEDGSTSGRMFQSEAQTFLAKYP